MLCLYWPPPIWGSVLCGISADSFKGMFGGMFGFPVLAHVFQVNMITVVVCLCGFSRVCCCLALSLVLSDSHGSSSKEWFGVCNSFPRLIGYMEPEYQLFV